MRKHSAWPLNRQKTQLSPSELGILRCGPTGWTYADLISPLFKPFKSRASSFLTVNTHTGLPKL